MNERLPQANARSCAVWTSRYGALPMVVVTGVGPTRSPAVSRSTSSADAAVVPGEVHDRLADEVVRVAGVRSGPIDAEDHRHRIGRARRVVAEDGPDVLDLGRREGQDASMEVRPEWLEPELERRRDPEVPAGAAEAPEELGLVGLGRADEAAVGGRDLDGGQVVDRQPEVALQAADSPAERQPGDAGVADDADRADEAVRLGGDVELAEERAAIRSGDPGLRIDLDAAHRGQVDDEAAVGAREPGRAVAAGPDHDLEVVLAREADRRGDLRGRRRPDDDRGSPIVDRVPEPARVVVRRVAGRDDLAAVAAQLVEVAWRQRAVRVDHRLILGRG